MHFVRRSWKISYTGRLSRLGSPPLSPSPPPSPPPFGLGIREEGKSQAFRVFSKGSFVASPRDPYRIFLKEKIPLCSRTADRGGGKEGGREREGTSGHQSVDGTFASRYIVSLSTLPVSSFGYSTSRATRLREITPSNSSSWNGCCVLPWCIYTPFFTGTRLFFFFSFSFFFSSSFSPSLFLVPFVAF